MSTFEFSDEALEEFKQAIFYIAQDNIAAAEQFRIAVIEKCQKYAEFPKMGKERLELLHGCRVMYCNQYILLYRKHPVLDGIEIARMIHMSRDIERIMREK